MTAGKQIKVQVSVDQTSFAQTKAQIQQLVDLTAKLGKNLQGAGGGSGLLGAFTGTQQQSSSRAAVRGASASRNANAGLTDVVRQNLDLFKGLGSSGAASMGVLVDALKKATNQSQNELERQKRLVDSLTASYERLKAAGKDSLAEKRLGQVVSAQGGLASAASKHAEISGAMQAHYGGMMGGGPAGGAPTTGGFWSKENFAPQGRMPFIPKKLYDQASEYGILPKGGLSTGANIALGVGAVVYTGAKIAYQEARSATRDYTNAMAERGDMVGDKIRSLRHLDISRPLARRLAGGQGMADLGAQALGTGADIESGLAAAGSLKRGFQGRVSPGGGSTQRGALTGMATAGDTALMASYLQQEEQMTKTVDFVKADMGYKYLQSTLDARLHTQQLRGRGRADLYQGKDEFSAREQALGRKGFSVAAEDAALLQSRHLGMGGRFTGALMSASAGGYGGLGEVLKNAFVTQGAGNAMSAVRAAMGDTTDYTVGFQLANKAFGYNGRNVMDQSGFLAMAQGGGPMDQLGLNRFNLGVQNMDRMAAGRSGFERGQNLMSAIGAAAGLGTYSQDTLATMDTQTLANMAAGNLTDVQRAMGYTKEMAQSMLASRPAGGLATYVDQGGQSGMDVAMRAFRASGETDVRKFARQNPQYKAGLAAALQVTDPLQQMTEEGALGVLGLGDPTGKVKKGKIPGANTKFDDATQSMLDAKAEAVRKNSEDLMNNLSPIVSSLKTLGGEEGALEKWGSSLDSSTQKVAESLELLTRAIDMATFKISKGELDASKAKAGAKEVSKQEIKENRAIQATTRKRPGEG